MPMALPPGQPHPLGVTPIEGGANVAVVSRHAERVEICLIDHEGRETARHALPERTGDVHHGVVPGLGPGRAYGFRAHGEWAPERGRRFNPAKLLLDPYARAVTGAMRWEGPNLVDPADPFRLDPRDSAPFVPRAVVTPSLPAQPPLLPATPWERTVLYEAHVKGMTRLHPALPEAVRGRYRGLAHPAVLEHLVGLGVTAVELLPVACFIDELRLTRLGLVNYWGYNPLAFMAPDGRYAQADPRAEFGAMVQALHGAGLEVILDVVFNHTAEGDHLGPTLSLRGLDDALYYRHDPGRPGRYLDWAGCGNVLDFGRPNVVQLAMDSLRHWAATGIDGFRFDLGATLGRDRGGAFDPEAPFLTALRQDPQLAPLKLVMEPWDIGPGGYRPGGFTAPLAEWNDGFRDGVRRFWRGDEAVLPELATRLLGSAERYDQGGRRPWTGVNYVASHDGAPLADLVAFARKHNEANGEDNRDGSADEHSANYGIEGPSDDPSINALRARQRRNLLATLLLSQGTPMLLMGDELGRSQAGNTNAYCQDNATSWLDWRRLDDPAEAQLSRLRHAGSSPCAATTRPCARAASCTGRRPRGRPCPTPAGSVPTASRCRRRAGRTRGFAPAASSWPRRRPRGLRPGSCSSSSMPAPNRCRSACRSPPGSTPSGPCSTPRIRPPTAPPTPPAIPSPWPGGPCGCWRPRLHASRRGGELPERQESTQDLDR